MRPAAAFLLAALLAGCASTRTAPFQGLAIPSGSNVAVAHVPLPPDSARAAVDRALRQAGYRVEADEGGTLRTPLRSVGSGVRLAVHARVRSEPDGSAVEVRGYWRPGGTRGWLVRLIEPGDESAERAQWSSADRPYTYAFGRLAELAASLPGASVTYAQERAE